MIRIGGEILLIWLVLASSHILPLSGSLAGMSEQLCGLPGLSAEGSTLINPCLTDSSARPRDARQ